MNKAKADENDEPDVKYQIFISSPFQETEIRFIAHESVMKSGHFPVLMERIPAEAEPVEATIRGRLSQSQIYILILAHTYGSPFKKGSEHGSKKSYTEWEYELAVESPAKVLVAYKKRDL